MSASRRLGRRLLRTLGQTVPTVLGIVVINFFLLAAAPGDAADALAAESGSATAETMVALRHRFGLDDPLLIRLADYLDNLAHLSLGVSPRYNMPVLTLIGQRLPSTLLLMTVALGIALVLGVAAGAVMAIFAGRPLDRLLSILSLLAYSTPGFWAGLMLIVLFSVHLGWLPSGGSQEIGATTTGWAAVLDGARHMVLPALSLGLFYMSTYARLTRASMLEVKTQDFVRTARAKGLSPLAVNLRHVLRNALIPITTLAGMHVGAMLGGAVVVETVYSWPGLGRLAFEAVMARDFNVLLGILLLSSLLVVVVNVLVDVLQAWLDPRVGARA